MDRVSQQQNFWKNIYSKEYIERNPHTDQQLGLKAWSKMLDKIDIIDGGVKNILECGSNIGRNIALLNLLFPGANKSIIELSEDAFEIVTKSFILDKAQNCSIVSADFASASFDLVYISGVLIHVHPDDVLANLAKMYEWSNKYILINEYFNRTPVMLEYRGEKDKLFKSDFGKTFMQNFDVKLVDYGFLWGYEYDNGGFDDTTFWLLKKSKCDK